MSGRRVSDSIAVEDFGNGLRPGWNYEHTVRRDWRFRRSAHLFTGLRYDRDPFGNRLTIAALPSVCRRVEANCILDFAGTRPPPNACAWCLRAGRRLGLVPPEAA